MTNKKNKKIRKKIDGEENLHGKIIEKKRAKEEENR